MMRLALGQFNFDFGNFGPYAAHGKRRKPPADPCKSICDSGNERGCILCQAGGDLRFSTVSMYGNNNQAQPLQGYYYPPQQLGQPQPPLGQSITDSPASMFVVGALTWAFFGPVIKGVLGLGASAASFGVEKAHGQLNKARAGGGSAGRKRLPPPSGSDDNED